MRRTSALIQPSEPLQVEAAIVAELDAFLLEAASLECVAAVPGRSVGHLAPGIDHSMPGELGPGFKVLKHVAHEPRTPGQASHRGNLSIGRDPTRGYAADDGADRGGGLIIPGRNSRGNLARPFRRTPHAPSGAPMPPDCAPGGPGRARQVARPSAVRAPACPSASSRLMSLVRSSCGEPARPRPRPSCRSRARVPV